MLLDLRTLEEPISGTGAVAFGVAVSATAKRITPQGIGAVGTEQVMFDLADSGLSATGNVGSVLVSPDVTVGATGVFGTGSVGTDGVAFDLGTTGQSSTSSAGSLASLSVNVALSGQAATGDVTAPTAGETFALTGLPATTSIGSVTEGDADALSGLEAATATGTLSLSSVVGTTGDSATGDVGTEVPGDEVTAVGQFGTGSLGSETLSIDVPLSGESATGATGTVSNGADATAALTGEPGTSAIGSEAVSFDLAVSGQSATSAIGSVGLAQAITSNAGTTSIGSTVASDTLALSGASAVSAITSVGAPVTGTADVTIGVPGLHGVGLGAPIVASDAVAQGPLLPRPLKRKPRAIRAIGRVRIHAPAISAIGRMAPAIKATGHVSVASLGLEGVAGLGYTAKAEIVAPVATSQAVGRLYEVERAKAATPARDISGVGDLRIASGHAVGEFEQALPDAVDLAWSELQRTTIDPNLDDDACMALGVFE